MKKQGSTNPLLYLSGKLWDYSIGNRRSIAFYLLLSVASECVSTFWGPLVTASIIDVVEKKGVSEGSMRGLLFLLFLIPLGSAISWGLHGPSRIIEESNAFLARVNYRKRHLMGVLSVPLEWHTEHHTGDTIDRIEKGANSVYEFGSETFQFVKPIVKLVGCFGAVVYFSKISAIIVIAVMIIGVIITVKIDRVCGLLIRDLSRHENKISEAIHDVINNISTVITLRIEKLVFASIMHKVEEPFEKFRRTNSLNEFKWFLTSMCTAFMTAVISAIYLFEHKGVAGTITVSSFYLVISYLDKISELFYQFTNLYGWTVRRMFRLINGEELTLDFKESAFVNHLLPKDWREVRVENLSFSYNTTEDFQHLDGVSFVSRRGEKIALVGSTGSGKSTFLSVMRDLYHPQEGQVSVDGVVIPTGFEGICQAISLVQQKPEIFERSIRENITLGVEYSDELVRLYSEVACFTEVVEELPKGYDSMIKEKGVNLSGGQVQRLALTRGLLASHDKDIILLDEPTSSLDMVTTMAVFRRILRQFRDKTVISSVHTLQVLPLFDRVCMFHQGKIVGTGTVPELLKTCQEFADLWQKQFESE